MFIYTTIICTNRKYFLTNKTQSGKILLNSTILSNKNNKIKSEYLYSFERTILSNKLNINLYQLG